MNLTLTRTIAEADGIFGHLTDSENGNVIAATCEHSYDDQTGRGSYTAKIPPGVYTCKRGMHRLEGMAHDFECFEIENVPGHTGCLIHPGNFGSESSGCVLVGQAIKSYQMTGRMVTNSKASFAALMKLQEGLDTFVLTVVI